MISVRQNHGTISTGARIGMRRRILVVAQQIELRARIARVLQSAGYAVELADNQKRAIELAAGKQIEAAIVVHNSDLNGLEKELRDHVPRTIVLGHRTDEILRPGHSLRGADAFPVQALDEQKLLDQLGPPTASPGAGQATGSTLVILKIEDCQLDLAAHTFVDGNGQEVQLTRAENALLATFVGSPRRVLSRDQLCRAVVGRGADSYDRSIDMLVARLRRKIEPNPKAPRFILSVPGVGYKFALQPQTAEDINALPAIDLEKFNRSGEARPVTPPGQGIASRHSEPEKRQVTALSCVLVGLTAGAVSLDPEDLIGIVQRFQEICTTVITQWGGVVANSVGDEILALFGYPTGHEDNAERAVHAGLDLVANVGKLSLPSGEPLQTRIAIATGLVLIGENQSVIGEAIVMAGRLRNIMPPNSVNVAASTRKLLGSAFICDDPQLCALEGVSEPVTACRVTGKRAIESRFEARRSGKHTKFVGRQHELQQMASLWERAKGGKGQVVLLCGEAGIGKSSIWEAWLDRITDEPHVTMRFQCSPHRTNSPFYPVINQLEHVARFEREDTPKIKIKKLETVLSQAGPGTLADIPFFASLLSIPTDGFYSSPNLTPRRQRDLQITALLRQLLGLALTRPVVVKIADAHWMDSSTLELLSRSIGSIKTARVFVICSFRPEFFPHWLDESHVTMLRLDRLSREQTGVIISDVAGGKELPRELHEQIMSKADGVPLFAEELTKAVLESGVLQDAGDRYVAVDPIPSPVVPATLLGSLTARLDRLGPSKEIAQIGAAIGREFSYRLLAAVAPPSGPSLQTALAHIAACELIFARGEPPNSTYIFKHALVQDAAYGTMVRSKRQQLHSRIADALMDGFPETVETQPELMAYHLAQAGLAEKATEYLRKAGQRAIEHSANAEAIGHLTRALELLRSVPESAVRKRTALGLEVMLGQAMITDRGYAAPETKGTLLRAKTLIDSLTDPPQKFAVLYGIWACHYVGGEVAKQRDAALEFLAEAERHNDAAALCIAHRALGTTCVTTGEFAEGLHHLERARALYDAEQHPCYRFQYGQDIGVAALCYLSWAQWHLGYVDQASEVAAEAMKRAEELSHPHTLVYAICHARGFMDLFRHHCEDIQSYPALVVSLCTENGFSHWLNCGRILEGWAKICRGEVDQGIEVLRAGVLGWKQRGARLWLPIFLTVEAEACAKAGLADAALQAIEEAHTISRDTGERWAMAEVLRVKARLLLATGRAQVDEIEAILVNSLEIARQQQARCWELRASCDLARLWQGQGREKKALKLLQSVYDQFTEGLDTAELRDAKALIRSLRQKLGGKQSGRPSARSGSSPFSAQVQSSASSP
jgi:DNA-binding response OmpR family regulator/class 3 adenylate cyclase/predicted ATPase